MENELRIKRKQDELESLYRERVNGIIVNSHANWMNNGEKCTALFLKLNQRNFAKKIV